ncbi:MAG: hypothetical protein IT386_14450 [Deltaproteobacteria bacterium]|nr:hypothetical protein [Deltaproteobacteria bacterium]
MPTEEERILAALRAYPLYDFDRRRVEHRAFYLGEQDPRPLNNWLDAERTETVLQAEEALVFPKGERTFLLEYALVDHLRFVTNEPRQKEYRGNRDRKRCAVCDRTAPDASFRTAPHLLPACTGNRFLFTREECDDCNLDAGQQTEDDLGKMLGPHRAVARIQTRNRSSATLRLGERTGAIGGQDRDEPLRLAVVEGDTTVEVRDLGDNLLEVSGQGAPYRPISALRSLGRAAWHLLPDDAKVLHGGFLEWVRGNVAGPARYVEAFIPGPGLRHTTFAVWRRVGNDNAIGPALVFVLALGGLVLVVPSQESPTSRIPLVPLPYSPYGPPQLRMMTATEDRPTAPRFSYQMRYLSRYLLQTADALRVKAVMRRAQDEVSIEVDLELAAPARPEQVAYTLRGGQLRGEIGLSGDPLRLTETGAIVGGAFHAEYGLPHDAVG